jgi:DNA-binding FadR family transcriptional regulator
LATGRAAADRARTWEALRNGPQHRAAGLTGPGGRAAHRSSRRPRHVQGGRGRVALADAEGLQGASPADVLECRLLFEPELAPLVVARASQADLDRMEECLRGAEAADSVPGFEVWDGALHDAIAEATHNQASIAVIRALARVRLQAQWGELKLRSMTPERKAVLDAEHRAIVEAFRRRDKTDARMRLREHIQHVHAYMFGE